MTIVRLGAIVVSSSPAARQFFVMYFPLTCLHCMTLVDEFWKTDCLQEETVEQLLIEVNGDHDDEDEDDQDDDGSDEEVFVG